MDLLIETLTTNSLRYISGAAIIVCVLIFVSLFCEKTRQNKQILFLGIVIPVVLSTVYAASVTVYINMISETRGPVHWHADFEIWNCGKKIDIIDPTGLSNRIGTPLFHEHNDDRIHVEGVIVEKHDVALAEFFHVIDGELTEHSLEVPTSHGSVLLQNGDRCNSDEGFLQVFLYRVLNPDATQETGFVYEQVKLDDVSTYIIAPHSYVPQGDCLIFEFGPEKNKTEKICETYEAAIQKGDLIGS
jgi:hypothetical protein